MLVVLMLMGITGTILIQMWPMGTMLVILAAGPTLLITCMMMAAWMGPALVMEMPQTLAATHVAQQAQGGCQTGPSSQLGTGGG